MSLHNANAFYELAIRHLNGMPTIHMIRTTDDIPFDNAPYRAIRFSYAEPSEIEAAQLELKSVVDEVIKPGFETENPITHARGIIELQQKATAPQKVLLDAVSELERRLTAIERKDTKLSVRKGDVVLLRNELARREKADEPTMDEILASIRRIIAKDGPQGAA